MFSSVRGNLGGLNRSFTDLRNNVRSSFNQIHDDIHRKLQQSVHISRESGRNISKELVRGIGRAVGEAGQAATRAGKAVVSGVADAIKKGHNIFHKAFTGVMEGSLSGVLTTPVIGPIITAGLVTVAAGLAPIIASAIGGSLILGIGSALTGAGIAALLHTEDVDKKWSKSEQKRVAESNKQAEKLKHQWLETGRYVINGMKEVSQPLIPVLDTVRGMVKSVGSVFKPVLESAFALTAGPLKGFAKDLGAGIKELAPAVKPLMETFSQLLETIGPMLPGIFADISDSLINLSTTVMENKDIFAGIFYAMAESVPMVINALAGLIDWFRTFAAAGADAYATVTAGIVNMADSVLGILESMFGALAAIPGPWQEAMRSAASSVAEARAELQGWKSDAEAMPKIIRIQGDIQSLEAKLTAAKRSLKDPNLTKTRKAEVKAEIKQLQSAIAQAKAALASVRSKTVIVNVAYTSSGRSVLNGTPSVGAYDRRHGGIVGGGISAFAQGGIAGAGGATALVGEAGPELVRLPYGSTVVPSGQTRAQLGLQSGRTGGVSTTFRSGIDATVEMVKAVRQLTQALKEVITLRDAMGKLTGSVFGQHKALMAYEQAWDDAQKSLKKHKQTLNIHTEAGRNNRLALLGLAESAHEVVFQMDEAGRSSQSMYNKMREQRREFIRMARAMGLSSKAARKLADDYGLIPSKVKKAAEAEDKLTRQNKAIERKNKAIEKANKAAGFAAAGGPRSGLTLVGELGPELVRLPFGSHVIPAGQSENLLATGGSGASGILHITLQIGSTALGELIIDPLRKSIRTRGGNVQAVLGKGV